MNCIDCGEHCAAAFTPLCEPCARIAVTLLGSEDARLKLLGEGR